MKIKAALVSFKPLREKIEKAGQNLGKDLRQAMDRISIRLVAEIKKKLSDDVLKVQTGTLRRSITYKIDQTDGKIVATVGTNLAYGAVHEFGYTGPQQVAEYSRKVNQAFGRPLTQPTVARVRAHVRNVRFPERSFVRSTLSENLDMIQFELEKATSESIKKELQ
jgi:phage gpG-like protein